MEAVPRMPMIWLDLKEAGEFQFSPSVKQFILKNYGENPENYNEQLKKLEQLRQSAVNVTRDFEGCSTLRKYFGQLHYLQSRVPLGSGQEAAVPISWTEIFSGKTVTHDDISYEQACILYNLGALHSMLGAMDNRVSEEGMKVSCTHFQCSAGAFSYLRDHFSHNFSVDMSHQILNLNINLMLGQAQECLLEKSMLDNRKSFLVARISAQVVDYYKEACRALENSETASLLGKIQKDWKKLVQMKIYYFAAIAHLHMGKQAEEQQKYGERLAYLQSSLDKLSEAVKLAKGQPDSVQEALRFTMDVIGGKFNSAKKDNDFIYHESVPALDTLPSVKGAPLVKALPVNPTDPSVTGPDIFSKLVPMAAHEASSLYSEEKAKLLRDVMAKINSKNETLEQFMDSLCLDPDTVDNLDMYSHIPPVLMEKCAALSVRPDTVKSLIQSMQTLSGVFTDVEASLREIRDVLDEDEAGDRSLEEVVGKQAVPPPPPALVELRRDLAKYLEAHEKASFTNTELHRAMNLHISNLRLLGGPLDTLREALPHPELSEEEVAGLQCMKRILGKVQEMRDQRSSLEKQLRELIHQDDITAALVTTDRADMKRLFEEQLKKYEQVKVYIDQNLAAQENILKALTEANVQYASVRKSLADTEHKWNTTVQTLVASYEAYEDLMKKSQEGKEFYEDLEGKASRLLERARAVCKARDEERQALLDRELQKKAPPRPTAPKPPLQKKASDIDPASSMEDPELAQLSAAILSLGGDLPEELRSMPPDFSFPAGTRPPAPEAFLPGGTGRSPLHWPGAAMYTPPRFPPHLPPPEVLARLPHFPTQQPQGFPAALPRGPLPQQQPQPPFPQGPQHPPVSGYGLPPPQPQPGPPGGAVPVRPSTTTVDSVQTPITSYTPAPGQPALRAPVPHHPVPPAVSAGYTVPPQMGHFPQYPPQPGVPVHQQQPFPQPPAQFPHPAGQQQPHYQPLPGPVPGPASIPGPSPGPGPAPVPGPASTQQPTHGPRVPLPAQPQYPHYMPQPRQPVPPHFQQPAFPGQLPPQVRVGLPSQPQAGYLPPASLASQPHVMPGPHPPQPHLTPASQAQLPPHAPHPQMPPAPQAQLPPHAPHPQMPPASQAQLPPHAPHPQMPPASQAQLPPHAPHPQMPRAPLPAQAQLPPASVPSQPHLSPQPQLPPASHPGQPHLPQPQPPIRMPQQPLPPHSGAMCYPGGAPMMPHQAPPVTPQQPQPLAPQPLPSVAPTSYSAPPAAAVSAGPLQHPTAMGPPPGAQPLPQHMIPPSSAAPVSQPPNVIPPSPVPSPSPSPGPPSLGLIPQRPSPALTPVGGAPLPPPAASSSPPTSSDSLFQRQSSSTDDLLSSSPESQHGGPKATANVLLPTKADPQDGQRRKKPEGVRLIEGDPYQAPERVSRLCAELERFRAAVQSLERPQPDAGAPSELDLRWKELQELQEKDARQLSIAIARCYSMKNRHQDIMPYDRNRVVLQSGKDDYINASTIEDLSPYCPRIIATQAPLTGTAADFWLMVYEQKVSLVVMLVSEQELEKQKVLPYYPLERGQQLSQGPITLTLTTQKNTPTHVERMIGLQYRDQSLKRTVIHLQFTSWPELGLPDSKSNLIRFIQEVHGHYLHQRPLHTPIVVHCSSGVGRTGALCLLYAALQELEAGNGIPDLPLLVRKMRQQRKNMLQEKLHLKFCYEAVLKHAEQVLQRHGICTAPSSKSTNNTAIKPYSRQESQDIVLGGDMPISSIQATIAKLSIRPPGASEQGPDPGQDLPPSALADVLFHGDLEPGPAPTTQDPPPSESLPVSLSPPPPSSPEKTHSTPPPNQENGNGLDGPDPASATANHHADPSPAPAPALPPALGSSSSSSSLELLASLTPEAFTLDSACRGKQRISKQSFLQPHDGLGLQVAQSEDDPLSNLDPLWTLNKT
ncbi:tyrosine-protein phosphatase non-receptor type 23 [Megalops cyprinoides]|uniref:tyrosine-protein phosphatase non-receptor type 23 n=1 Tax=Megalops cyprinoides TaxID=118141 RepID=UPI0018654631|nr:tyrosine-protein phosphatase non-receptor type 23 [Megalops cyprinoides]